MLYKQLTLIVISILWLLNPTIVVGSQFMDWVDSITYCPECLSYSQSLRSNGNGSTTFPTEERGSLRGLPTCVDPNSTPAVFKKPDVPAATNWIIGDATRSGDRVNDGTDNCTQVTDVSGSIDLNVPDELATVIANHGQVGLVDNTRSSIGIVTSCGRDGTINFVGGNSSQPAVDSKGKGTGFIAIPPTSGKRMVPHSTLGNTFATYQIPTNKCNVCDNTPSVFVRKPDLINTVAQTVGMSTSELYGRNIIPNRLAGQNGAVVSRRVR